MEYGALTTSAIMAPALAVAIAITGAASLAGLLAPLIPWVDAANHVRPLLMLASLCVFVAVRWLASAEPPAHSAGRPTRLRQRMLHGATAVVAANGILLMLPLLSSASWHGNLALASGEGRPLKLVTFNMAWIDRPIDKLSGFLLAEAPDVILLQEVTPRHATALRSKLQGAYPHIHACTIPRSCSLMLLSRGPLSRAGEAHRAADTPEMIWAQSGALRIHGVHAAWPFRPFAQAEQVGTLIWRARAVPSPAIFAGDFNLTPWSYQLQRLLLATGLKRHATFLRSWPTDGQMHLPAPAFLIDHVLSTPDIRTASIRIGPNMGSDHLPVIATLIVP